ncbi:MAG: type III-B CRISPR module RAMP protein Cmr6 [bacterium JZ-2024 1]
MKRPDHKQKREILASASVVIPIPKFPLTVAPARGSENSKTKAQKNALEKLSINFKGFFKNYSNLGLLLNKYYPPQGEISIENEKKPLSGGELAHLYLDALTNYLKQDGKKLLNPPVANSTILSVVKERQYAIISEFSQKGWLKNSFPLRTLWRLIVGLGAPSTRETGITLHHIFGIPYIPASAIKGATRSLAFWQLFENTQIWSQPPDESDAQALQELLIRPLPHQDDDFTSHLQKIWKKKANKEDVNIRDLNALRSAIQEFHATFGTQEKAGLILFLDAFPQEEYRLALDIMNPHHPRYYRGEISEASDREEPNPVYFLTLENATFTFHLLLDENRAKKMQYNSTNLLNKATSWLKSALQQAGIGAKTSVGYGYFGGV